MLIQFEREQIIDSSTIQYIVQIIQINVIMLLGEKNRKQSTGQDAIQR